MEGTSLTSRPGWDEYLMTIARSVAARATCNRKQVGAVIVSPFHHILATGYNGSLPGFAHCSEVGCEMEDGHCIRTVHAEANAITQAARTGQRLVGGTIYVTASPCWPCFKLIVSTGLQRVLFGEMYRDQRILKAAQEAGIELVDLSKPAVAPEAEVVQVDR